MTTNVILIILSLPHSQYRSQIYNFGGGKGAKHFLVNYFNYISGQGGIKEFKPLHNVEK